MASLAHGPTTGQRYDHSHPGPLLGLNSQQPCDLPYGLNLIVIVFNPGLGIFRESLNH